MCFGVSLVIELVYVLIVCVCITDVLGCDSTLFLGCCDMMFWVG